MGDQDKGHDDEDEDGYDLTELLLRSSKWRENRYATTLQMTRIMIRCALNELSEGKVESAATLLTEAVCDIDKWQGVLGGSGT